MEKNKVSSIKYVRKNIKYEIQVIVFIKWADILQKSITWQGRINERKNHRLQRVFNVKYSNDYVTKLYPLI